MKNIRTCDQLIWEVKEEEINISLIFHCGEQGIGHAKEHYLYLQLYSREGQRTGFQAALKIHIQIIL